MHMSKWPAVERSLLKFSSKYISLYKSRYLNLSGWLAMPRGCEGSGKNSPEILRETIKSLVLEICKVDLNELNFQPGRRNPYPFNTTNLVIVFHIGYRHYRGHYCRQRLHLPDLLGSSPLYRPTKPSPRVGRGKGQLTAVESTFSTGQAFFDPPEIP